MVAAHLAATAATVPNTVGKDSVRVVNVRNPLFRAQSTRKMEVVGLKLGAHFVEIRNLDLVVLCMGFVEVMRDIVGLGFAVSFLPSMRWREEHGIMAN